MASRSRSGSCSGSASAARRVSRRDLRAERLGRRPGAWTASTERSRTGSPPACAQARSRTGAVGRVDQRGLRRPAGVVPGGAVAGPGGGQRLVALEDLLDPDRGAGAGRRAQLGRGSPRGRPARRGGRSGSPSMMPSWLSVEQHPVGGLEHVGQLDPHRDQLVDVEEAAVVQHVVGARASWPAGSAGGPAPSATSSPVGAERDREDVVVVADHPAGRRARRGRRSPASRATSASVLAEDRAGRAGRRRTSSRRRTSARWAASRPSRSTSHSGALR